MEDEKALGLRALNFPDELWAWLGPVKATKCKFTKLNGAGRWDFEWSFRRTIRMEDLEFIVNHELLLTKDNWLKGQLVGPPEMYVAYITIFRDGTIH